MCLEFSQWSMFELGSRRDNESHRPSSDAVEDAPMLIRIGKVPEPARPIVSLVRLKVLDVLDMRPRQSWEHIPNVRFPFLIRRSRMEFELGRLIIDGKLRSSLLDSTVMPGQFEYEVVQSGSEILYQLSRVDGSHFGWPKGWRLIAVLQGARFNVNISDSLLRAFIEESLDKLLHGIEVFLSPCSTQIRGKEWMHGVPQRMSCGSSTA
jgi:hypothetical protein